MNGAVKVFKREPKECDVKEIGDFMAFVVAGGEVTSHSLESRIRAAGQLIFLNVGDCLSGIAALKHPNLSYRDRVSASSGVPLMEEDYPFELGWVFVMPSARGRKFSIDLTRAAVEAGAGKGIFATSRTDNAAMHSSLRKCGFSPVGSPYASTRGEYSLQLFIRPAVRNISHGLSRL
jgi:hypothetical protein